MKKLFIGALIIIFLMSAHFVVRADIDQEIAETTKELAKLNADLATKTVNYQEAQKQLEDIRTRIIILSDQIKTGEAALVYQKELLNERVKSYYKNVNVTSLSLVDVLVSENLSESLRKFFYQKSLVDEDKKTIIKVVLYIKNLEDQKAKLAALKIQVDLLAKGLLTSISKIKQQIAVLSARQQALIAQKLASLNISRSAASPGRCIDDRNIEPGFSGTRLALFTYGVPNRIGLNQWGGYGRAQAGQGYDQILHAYYNFDSYDSRNINIKVNNGNGINQGDIIWNGSLEDYIKRIYEVPDGWPAEILKAQTIAARSYAIAATNNGQDSICANENCQVFQTNSKGGSWESAVKDTVGKVMIQGGQPIKAWFSSTHGGYVLSSGEVPGWSATSWTKHTGDFDGSVGSFSDLQNKAYDRNSPWFYCDWGYRSQYNKTAWLKSDELADIINVILLARSDSSTTEHLYQTDKPNPAGTDTWSPDRVKQELINRGGKPFSSINSVSVSADFGSGRTTSVSVSGDGSAPPFDGAEFKNWFNLRAPANIQIVGPLYNIEQK